MQTVRGCVRALHDHVIVSDLQIGERVTQGGIVLLDDNAKSQGIRPRWAKVYVVGPKQQDIEADQWVLIEHGRWSRGFKLIDSDGIERMIHRADVEAILAVSDQPPQFDDTINSNAV
jgi:co-chaperonin GroES (HSP10)